MTGRGDSDICRPTAPTIRLHIQPINGRSSRLIAAVGGSAALPEYRGLTDQKTAAGLIKAQRFVDINRISVDILSSKLGTYVSKAE